MRIATWNVNSLKARLEAVERWLERAEPDVLLLQETKLADDDVPEMLFRMAGYELLHHGEGRWNGVAIASRVGLADPVVSNFGNGPVRLSRSAKDAPSADDFDPLSEARMVSAVCGGVRVASLYAPNGRLLDSSWYAGKLRWFERLAQWLEQAADPSEALLLGGDLNVTPTDEDVWDAARVHGGTHVSEPERAAFRALLEWGLVDTWRAMHPGIRRFTWWDYRAGGWERDRGLRIDHFLVTRPILERMEDVVIHRAMRAEEGPSDHVPLTLHLED